MEQVFKNIKKTPPTLPQNPDRSWMAATAPRAQSGNPITKTFSTPDLKDARNVDSKPDNSDQGFATMNPYRDVNPYAGNKKFAIKIKSGKKGK